MPDATAIFAFALIAPGLVLTPGPNMIYLISRPVTQGQWAGMISLTRVALGFVTYMLCAALGITTLALATSYVYDALWLTGAGYLMWLKWQVLRSGGRSGFELRNLAYDSPRRLFTMRFITNLPNPNMLVVHLSLLPQFIQLGHGMGARAIAGAGRRSGHDQRDGERADRAGSRFPASPPQSAPAATLADENGVVALPVRIAAERQ